MNTQVLALLARMSLLRFLTVYYLVGYSLLSITLCFRSQKLAIPVLAAVMIAAGCLLLFRSCSQTDPWSTTNDSPLLGSRNAAILLICFVVLFTALGFMPGSIALLFAAPVCIEVIWLRKPFSTLGVTTLHLRQALILGTVSGVLAIPILYSVFQLHFAITPGNSFVPVRECRVWLRSRPR